MPAKFAVYTARYVLVSWRSTISMTLAREPLERFCCGVRLSLLRYVEGLADIAPDPRWKFPEVIAGRSYPENRLQHAPIIQVHVYLYMYSFSPLIFLDYFRVTGLLGINVTRPLG